MSHMSSSDEISPVIKPRVNYAVQVEGMGQPLTVTCDDIVSEANYVRFMDGQVPAAVVPAHRLIAAARVAAAA